MQRSFLPFRIPLSRLEDNLFLGSVDDAYNQKKLLELKVTHVLNVAAEVPNFHPQHFTYYKLNAQDSPSFNYSPHFDAVADFIDSALAKGRILVHCFVGISRSTSAIVAYLMKYRQMTLPEAITFIKKKRSIICPNPGFIKQLNRYKQKMVGKTQYGDLAVTQPLNSSTPPSLSHSTSQPIINRRNFQIRDTTAKAPPLRSSSQAGLQPLRGKQIGTKTYQPLKELGESKRSPPFRPNLAKENAKRETGQTKRF